jgi:hypothetical protein
MVRELRLWAAAAAGPAAGTSGPSQPLATLTVGQPLPAEQTEVLRFNPWTTGPGIRPSGCLNLFTRRRLPGKSTGPARLSIAPAPATKAFSIRAGELCDGMPRYRGRETCR